MTDQLSVSGSLRALLLFDIAEEIDLPLLRDLLGIEPSGREPAFRHPAPEYVRFERPPVVQHVGPRQIDDGKQLQARIRYFEYGVASVELRMHFHTSWDGLVHSANRWIMSPELEGCASHLLHERVSTIQQALKRSYDNWISEDYYIIQLDPIQLVGNAVLQADELLR